MMYRTADSVTPPIIVHHVELCPATGDPLLVEGPEEEYPESLDGLVPEIGDEYTGGLESLGLCGDVL